MHRHTKWAFLYLQRILAIPNMPWSAVCAWASESCKVYVSHSMLFVSFCRQEATPWCEGSARWVTASLPFICIFFLYCFDFFFNFLHKINLHALHCITFEYAHRHMKRDVITPLHHDHPSSYERSVHGVRIINPFYCYHHSESRSTNNLIATLHKLISTLTLFNIGLMPWQLGFLWIIIQDGIWNNLENQLSRWHFKDSFQSADSMTETVPH